MGSIDGWVDPEVKAMQDMIYGAVDASFEDRNRAKEGAHLPSTTCQPAASMSNRDSDAQLSSLMRSVRWN